MTKEPYPVWKQLHKSLQEALKKEVDTMREILANLHQEELCLVMNDQGSFNRLLQERDSLMTKLNSFKKNRIDIFHALRASLPETTGIKIEAPEDLACVLKEESCETLLLKDQQKAIIERINLQSSRNKALADLPSLVPITSAAALPLLLSSSGRGT